MPYNHLNQPTIFYRPGLHLTFEYDANGTKMKSVDVGTGNTTEYVDGIVYKANGVIDFIQTEEGRAFNNGGTYTYQYNLSDHLGNVRYSFDIYGGAVRRLQEDDYYAFGLRKSVSPVVLDNRYLYNGKELKDGLGQYDYGARFYDPVLGRFSTIDPLSEVSRRFSPYSYALNNPIRFIDVDGMYAAPPDIWRFDTDTKELTLVKETDDKFDTFINENNKVITTTNASKEENEIYISKYSGVSKSMKWVKDYGELGKAVQLDQEAKNTMTERAKENGYAPTGISRLEDQGDRQIAFDRTSAVRDALVDHKVGPSAFKEAKGFADSEKTFKDVTGFSLNQVLGAVAIFLANPISNTKDAYDKIKTTTLNGIQSIQNGNYRGL